MWRRAWILSGLFLGCGSSSGSADSFVGALPSRQTLDVSMASGGAASSRAPSSALVGQTAELYVVTRQTAAQVNALVGGPLDALSAIARTPPAVVGPDGAAWGPLTDALSPVVWRLVVTRLGPGAHAFQLGVRPKDGGDVDFQPFLQGGSQAAGPAGPGQGSFSVDLDLAHRLDPVANPADGQLVAGWNVAPDQRDVQVHLAGVQTPGGPSTTADVGAVLFPDGSGALAFDAALDEAARVGSRWNASGAGRGDAELHGGDAGAGVVLSECWDASFGRVYFRAVSADGGVATEGDAAGCVFAEPLR